MASIKEIKENLETVSRIKNIASTYQDIANLRMNQIRENVLKNREFFNELLDTYQKVRSAYFLPLTEKKKKKEKTVFREAKKEKIVLFLSTDQLFYGTLIIDIWKQVQKYLEQNKANLAVVGKTGKRLAENSGLGHKMFYFQLNDVKPEKEKLAGILDFIKNYKKIIVFHGKYEKVLSQKPAISEISGELPWQEEKMKTKPKIIESYIFEPSAEKILDFFEKEIIAVLFNQTILEHQLARYASRVIAMHQANENAKKEQKKLLKSEFKLRNQKQNKKQVEFFNSIYGAIY